MNTSKTIKEEVKMVPQNSHGEGFARSVHSRYGFIYDPSRNPLITEQRHARPLHDPEDNTDWVKEHGEWCLARCNYPENRQAIQELLDRHAAELEA